ncbi:hypothetical protein LCGC14_0342740 [marine sediment metagenome]|uniref:Uncharacterized protein n=1 Tax=marine sediment metagenome TaxID=412755 RepID=A0A0F9W0S0_9ZZZZ
MKIIIPPYICETIDKMIEVCIQTEIEHFKAFEDGTGENCLISADDGYDDVTEELRERIIDLLNSEQKINHNIIKM